MRVGGGHRRINWVQRKGHILDRAAERQQLPGAASEAQVHSQPEAATTGVTATGVSLLQPELVRACEQGNRLHPLDTLERA